MILQPSIQEQECAYLMTMQPYRVTIANQCFCQHNASDKQGYLIIHIFLILAFLCDETRGTNSRAHSTKSNNYQCIYFKLKRNYAQNCNFISTIAFYCSGRIIEFTLYSCYNTRVTRLCTWTETSNKIQGVQLTLSIKHCGMTSRG